MLFCLSLVLFLSLFSPGAVYATTCLDASLEDILTEHELIFRGRALSSGETTPEMKLAYERNRNPELRHDRGLPNAYTDFEVLKVYKGVPGEAVRIFYETYDIRKKGYGIAGDYSVFPYEKGDDVVLYVRPAGGFYITFRGQCSIGDRAKDGNGEFETLAQQYADLEAEIAQNPLNADLYANKISLHEAYKDYTAAVETYNKYFIAVGGSREKPELRADYGRFLYLVGRYHDALAVLQDVRAVKGADTFYQLSLVYLGRAAELAGQKIDFSNQKLSNITIKDADFSGADFSKSTLRNVRFVNVTLKGADFTGASLQASFTSSDLAGAFFTKCMIRGELNGNTFDNVDFTGANLNLGATRDNKFRGADFTGAKLHIMEGRSLGTGINPNTGNDFTRARFKQANVGGIGGSFIAGADFTGASFYSGRTPASQNQGLDLSGQKLDGSKLDSSDFSDSSFNGASLKQASFSGSHLKGVSFAGADLTGATFTVSSYSGQTQLQGADFSGAKVKDVNWEGAVFDCQTKFPQGFDTLAARLDADDLSCAKKPPLGMYEYSQERMAAGYLNPCQGDYGAACIYGLIINHALIMPTGSYSAARVHNFQDIAKSLLDAGEVELAKLLLMRAYAEHEGIFQDRPIDKPYFALLRRAGVDLSGTASAAKAEDVGEYFWSMRGRWRKSERDEALKILAAGDAEKTKIFLKQVLDREAGNSVSTHNKIDVLLNYADIFARLEGGLSPALVAELEKRIRTTPYLHFERNRTPPEPADYVLQGEGLLARALSGDKAPKRK